jgi:hypothetical protein
LWNSNFVTEPQIYSQNQSFWINGVEFRVDAFVLVATDLNYPHQLEVFRIESLYFKIGELHSILRRFYRSHECPLPPQHAQLGVTELVRSTTSLTRIKVHESWRLLRVVPLAQRARCQSAVDDVNHAEYFVQYEVVEGAVLAIVPVIAPHNLLYTVLQYAVVQTAANSV